MAEFGTIFKTLFWTVAVILAMQIQVGNKTVEKISYDYLVKSAEYGFIHQVARGTVKFSKDTFFKVKHYVNEGSNPKSTNSSH